ncbi:hypothetical protein CQW23_00087 [Capsicum baccatum]|uniref:Uncharacterized protein n=1 Tax=Capsicum baccatum TaxID=33114 RepID=A0A2G2XJP1_CAPBA|nr:hypothetical protein CQW23_00087 [Capsicum baccatum]
MTNDPAVDVIVPSTRYGKILFVSPPAPTRTGLTTPPSPTACHTIDTVAFLVLVGNNSEVYISNKSYEVQALKNEVSSNTSCKTFHSLAIMHNMPPTPHKILSPSSVVLLLHFSTNKKTIKNAGSSSKAFRPLECIACGNSWYASRDEAASLTIGPNLAKNVGAEPLATAKFEDVEKNLTRSYLRGRALKEHDEKIAGKMTTEGQIMSATTSMGATNIATSSRTTAPPSMAPAEKPGKFSGIDFKRWQQKMFFYLTTLCLQRFTSEDAPEVPEGTSDKDRFVIVEAWKHSDFLCRNYILSGLQDDLYNVYSGTKTAKELWETLERKYKTEDAGI